MVKLDLLGEESQFVDHLAPVWKALPEESRGNFMTHPAFIGHARSLGIVATPPIRDGTNPVLVASLGDMKRALKMGRTHIARMEHGIGQSYAGDPTHPMARHGSYAGGEGAESVEMFLVPNVHSHDRWQAAYPNARVRIIGCPKLDDLPAYRPDGERPIVGVAFHWNWFYLPETLSAFDAYKSAIMSMAGAYRILGHAHPKAAPTLSRWFTRNGIPYAEHFTEIAEKAAVFVADNTSALYEFASTGRPVVVLNIPEYRRNVPHGLRFWDAASVGVQVDHPRDLRAAVDLALLDQPEQQAAREASLDLVYAFRMGAAGRAVDELVDWLANLPERAPVRVAGPLTPRQRVEAYRAAV
jgi:hypothetical protein